MKKLINDNWKMALSFADKEIMSRTIETIITITTDKGYKMSEIYHALHNEIDEIIRNYEQKTDTEE